VDAAEAAIHGRLRGLQYDSDRHEERQLMEDAKRTLSILASLSLDDAPLRQPRRVMNCAGRPSSAFAWDSPSCGPFCLLPWRLPPHETKFPKARLWLIPGEFAMSDVTVQEVIERINNANPPSKDQRITDNRSKEPPPRPEFYIPRTTRRAANFIHSG
jgi:hypothetical protein